MSRTKMTDAQVKKHWAGLQKRHRAEISEAVVTLYLPGRSNQQVAKLLGYDPTWVSTQIDTYALVDCMVVQMGGQTHSAPQIAGEVNAAKETSEILSKHRKKIVKQDGYEERKEEIRDQFVQDLGLTEDNKYAADRLAESYLAAESAYESKQIVVDKENNRAKLQPSGRPAPDRKSWEYRLTDAFGKFKSVYHTFKDAKPDELRQVRTAKAFAEMQSDWEFISELVSIHNERVSK